MNLKKIKFTALTTSLLVTLSGCGGDKYPFVPSSAPPTAKNVTVSDVKQWIPVSGKLLASDVNGDKITYSFAEGGKTIEESDGKFEFSHGYLTLSGDQFTYTSISGKPVSIEYTATANGESATAQIEILNVESDPLVNMQWHLHNTGQKSYALGDEMKRVLIENPDTPFATYEGSDEEILAQIEKDFAEAEKNNLVPGEDMNVLSAYAQGATGKGVTAVVVDTGMEINHEDLVENVLPNRSLNLNLNANVRTDPTSKSLSGDHGTSVAGLIAAKGWNGLGGHGVAPDANLIGMNYLYTTLEEKVAQTDIIAHGFPGSGISPADEVVAFNRSYGISRPYFIGYSELEETIESYPNKMLRNGKGALTLKSSGNSFIGIDKYAGSMCWDNGAIDLGLTCLNGAFESSQGHPYYLSVAAVDANGKHTSYSTAGANVMISAPSGEFGRWHPAMVTTDQMTCINGYSGFNSRAINYYVSKVSEDFARGLYPFNFPGHPDNPNCNYTSTFNGTSSAAPNATGVVSLILSANNELTWRDVRQILAQTSTKVDPDNERVVLPIGDGEFVAHDGWIENAAGYHFNNLYGFGRIDAGKAVAMAKSYDLDLGQQIVSDWLGDGTVVEQDSLDIAIPDNNAQGASFEIEFQDDVVLEAIQFKFDVTNPEMVFGVNVHKDSGKIERYQSSAGNDLAIEVTSPSGTRSVLLSSKQALLLPAVDNELEIKLGYVLKESVFLSNAFYGENAKGTWTVRLLDTGDTNVDFTWGKSNLLRVKGLVNNQHDSVLEGVALRAFGRAAQ